MHEKKKKKQLCVLKCGLFLLEADVLINTLKWVGHEISSEKACKVIRDGWSRNTVCLGGSVCPAHFLQIKTRLWVMLL